MGYFFLGYGFTWLIITGIFHYLVTYHSSFELGLNTGFMEVFLFPRQRQVSFSYFFIVFLSLLAINL